MTSLPRIFWSKPRFSPYTLLALIPLIWLIAALFGIPVIYVAIVTIMLLVGVIGLLLVKQNELGQKANSKQRPDGIAADDQLIPEIRPETRAEIEMLQKKFLEMTTKIRQSELGKGIQGKTALYTLPWYITMGPYASGKSTLIKNSGLEFPLGIDEEVKGVSGTRSCDWWFTNEAIILDTAGRYTSERDERTIWLALLDQLKKYRHKLPLNGIIVCLSLPEVVHATANELEWQAQNIRSRLDDLMQRLGLQCPVYILFTKSDLVTGFVESFGQLNPDQADQVFGYTVVQQQATNPQARLLFEKEFAKILENLQDYRDSRSNVSPQKDRDSIYLYPLEMEAARENLALLLSKIFWQHPFQKTPMFRGFYFTSATQVGTPEDFISRKVIDEFSLSGSAVPADETDFKAKGFFIKRLFREIIVRDQGIARRISWMVAHQRWLNSAVLIAVVFATLLGLYGIWNAYDNSEQKLNTLAGQARVVSQMKWPGTDDDLYASRTEKFHQMIVELEARAVQAGIYSLWMDQSRRVLPGAYEVYFDALAPMVKDRVYIPIEQRMRRALADERPIMEREAEVYDALRAYTYFTDCRSTLNLSSQVFLGHYMAGNYTASVDEKNTTLLRSQMPFFAKTMTFLAAQPKGDEFGKEIFVEESRLVDDTRKLLATTRTPTAQNIVRDIKRKGEDILASSAIKTLINPSEFEFFDLIGRTGVENIYSIQAWDLFFKDYIEDKKWDSGPDCAMGTYGTPAGAGLDEDQKEIMVQQIKQEYFRQYSNAWLRLIEEVNLKPLKNLDDAARVLENLDTKNSQLVRLLESINEQTQFKNIKRPKGIMESGSQSIDIQFEDVRWLVEDKAGKKAVKALLKQYRSIATDLNGVKKDKGKIRNLAASTINKSPSGSLSMAYGMVEEALSSSDLKSGNTKVHEAVRALLKRPIDRALESLLAETQTYLNERWETEIHGQNPAKRVISADIINSFFRDGGTFWNFFDAQIAPFVDRQTLQIATYNQIGLKISERAINAFRQAKDLRESLASSGGGGGSFTVKPRTPINNSHFSNFDYVTFELGADGTSGIQKWRKNANVSETQAYDFRWPGPNPGGGAYIRLIDEPGFPFTLFSARGKTKASRGYDGIDGWRKLLNDASISGNRYTWILRDENNRTKAITFIITFPGGSGNKIARGIVDFDCPPTLD